MRSFPRPLFRSQSLLVAAILLSGCASIIEGSSQEIMVNTNPTGASCVFERSGLPIGTVDPTPSVLLVQKTKNDITIKCNKDGYQEATYINKSGSAAATAGNIVFGLLGGGIGWAVDSASGADNKYDSPVNITLVAEGETPVASKPVKKKTAPTSEAAAPTPSAASAATPAPAANSDFPVQK